MLETSRLKLVPLTHELLLLYKNNPKQLAQALNINFLERQHDPATLADVEEAVDFWMKGTLTHRDHFEWFTNWEIVLKHERVAVGGIGFAGLPDHEGKTMIGYGLDMRYHHRGYATEAVKAMLDWGFSHNELRCIVADTPLSNIRSQNVLIKNSFQEMSRDESLIHWRLGRSLHDAKVKARKT